MKNNIRNIIVLLNIIFACNAALPQVIAVIGDFENTPVRVDSVSMLVKSWNPDIIMASGDLYDAGSGSIDEQIGRYYADFICPYHGLYGQGAPSNEFFSAIGNHDMSDITSYLDYLNFPGNERYYSVQAGNVDFFVLNSNLSEPDGVTDTSAQALWLQNQLALAGSDWRIVVFHHPPYTSGIHPSTTYMQWPFAAWGADAVISGHNHFYERLYANGIPYFVNGSGGATLYSYGTLIPQSQLLYNKLWGAMKIEPYSDSLVFCFFTIRDSLIDRYVINKNQTGLNESMIIYPDLSNDNITIRFSGITDENLDIDLIDTEGRTINSYEDVSPVGNACSLKINLLKSGIYFVNVKSENRAMSGKFAVIR